MSLLGDGVGNRSAEALEVGLDFVAGPVERSGDDDGEALEGAVARAHRNADILEGAFDT